MPAPPENNAIRLSTCMNPKTIGISSSNLFRYCSIAGTFSQVSSSSNIIHLLLTTSGLFSASQSRPL
ncbi:hypothetical protein HK096_007491, partial [Nowakowskiella sp. JEL0078]